MNTGFITLMVLLILSAGCHSKPDARKTSQRGWIGGEFAHAEKGLLPRGENHRVYVQQIYANTPAAATGLQPGDRLLTLNQLSILSLKDFRTILDNTKPGTPLHFTFLRAGERLQGDCIAGKETYQTSKTLSLGLQFRPKLDLWPDTSFSLFGIMEYEKPETRVELNSGHVRVRQLQKSPPPTPPLATDTKAIQSTEGWKCWIGILGFGSQRRILNQEQSMETQPPQHQDNIAPSSNE